MDKNEELKFAKFFIDWLNNQYGIDYGVFPNAEENKIDPEIDIYARSKTGGEQLNFQMVTSEAELKRVVAGLERVAKKEKRSMVIGPFLDPHREEPGGWIKQAVRKKEKEYSTEVKQSLVLLVQKDIGAQFDEEYFKHIFSEFNDSEFKGIYLVHYPSESHHTGQILAIKELGWRRGSNYKR